MIPVRHLAWIAAAIQALAVPVASRACSGSAHIELREPGVYALDQATLAAAQPRLADCRSDELALTRRDAEVPLRIVGDRDGVFGPGARIEWVGEALHGPLSWFDAYSLDNVYILSARPGVHRRMGDGDGGPAAPARLTRRVHFEQQNEFIRLNRVTMKQGEEPDIWMWARLTHVDPKPFTYQFDLPDLAANDAGGTAVEAVLDLRGISLVTRYKIGEKPADHVVDVQFNGKPAATLKWDGRDEVRKKIELPRAAFKPTGNVLSLRVPERPVPLDPDDMIVDMIMFNWVEVAYPGAGNLAASTAPLQVAGDAANRASIELTAPTGAKVALYSAAGARIAARAGAGGRLRFDGVARGADLFPVVDGSLRAPELVRAVADADLRAPGDGYDYLIIAHRSLLDAVRPLAEFHRQRGLKVALLDVDAIYDAFNGGIAHPSAIRDLIAWGRAHWRVKPRYALLVGTASFDIRGAGKAVSMQPETYDPRTGVPFAKRDDNGPQAVPANRNLIPTWQFPSDEGQSASDNRFAVLDDKDFHPALAIGRFPVVTAAEAEAVVRKTIDYASAPDVGPWRHRVMLIANEDAAFQKASDQLALDLGKQGFATEKIYGNAAEADNLAHQVEISDGINSGELLVHFLGHGGRFIWRTGPPDLNKNHDLFTLDDVSNLQNGGRLPMVLSMTCFSAPFDNPNEDSIGERFLREPGRGAVAVFAASWSNSPSPVFSKQLVTELLKPGRAIGDAIVAAKKDAADRTMVEMYNLLGDPALVLEQPRQRLQIARSGDRWRDRIAVRVPESGFGGVVTVDWIGPNGDTVQSQTLEARDAQFELTVPAAAAAVRVYAANVRTGRDAFGSFELRAPPPAPAPAPAVAKPTALPKAPSAPPAGSAAPVGAVANGVDRIARMAFDAAGATAPRKADAKDRAGSGTAVAVEPRRGKCEHQQQRCE